MKWYDGKYIEDDEWAADLLSKAEPMSWDTPDDTETDDGMGIDSSPAPF